MIKLDENLLVELGLAALPKEEKTSFLKHMYETLEMRVGTRLAERMSDQQMSEFEQFINSNDEQGAFHWLESNFPNYKEVVAEEFEKLKDEIKPMAADILAASKAQAQQAVQTAGTQDLPAYPQQGQQPQMQQPAAATAPEQPQQQTPPAPQHSQDFAPQYSAAQPQHPASPPVYASNEPNELSTAPNPVQDPAQQQPGHHPQYPQQNPQNPTT